jgi:hypothetical protein
MFHCESSVDRRLVCLGWMGGLPWPNGHLRYPTTTQGHALTRQRLVGPADGPLRFRFVCLRSKVPRPPGLAGYCSPRLGLFGVKATGWPSQLTGSGRLGDPLIVHHPPRLPTTTPRRSTLVESRILHPQPSEEPGLIWFLLEVAGCGHRRPAVPLHTHHGHAHQ